MLYIKGKAMWAKVFEPDTRFDKDGGSYSTQVLVPETEAQGLCEQLEEMVNAKLQRAVKEQPKLKAVLSTRPVYEVDTDDMGNPTGDLIFKTKLKARVTSRDGRTFEQKPAVVDAKRTPMNGTQLIGNGSTIIVAVEPYAYLMQASKDVGVTLRLKGVQVLQLVEYGNTSSAIFQEEEGFVADAVAKDDATDVFNQEVLEDAEGDF